MAVERLKDYVQKLSFLELVGAFDNAVDALSFLLAEPVDLLFLDISLGGMSGIELLETATVSAPVVLTTAHPDYALKAFDLKVADYLLKPFTFARFVQAVERAQGRVAREELAAGRPYIFVKTEFRLEKIPLDQVLYIEGDSDYRRFHMLTKRIMTLETFAELEQRVPSDLICRVHKSYMVAIDKIESVERHRIKVGDAFISISSTYRDRFYAIIGHKTK